MSARERILILEDDEKLRTMVGHLLRAEGYEVDTAASGLEAIELAAQHRYDLVIADIRMEGVDGLEALARLKESQPELRSLVMTGYSTEADSIRAIRLGVGDYLRKPFGLDELMDSVQRLLAERRQELRQRAQEALLRRSLLRAVEAVARTLDLTGAPGRPAQGLTALGQRARWLAQTRGLEEAGAEEVQCAALIVALQRCQAEALALEEEDLPPSLRRCLRHVEERWNGDGLPDGLVGPQIPLESRLVAAALSEPDLDPELQALICQLEEDGEEASSTGAAGPAAESLRHLLSLGQALEAAGQLFEARHAYAQIGERAARSREGVQAALGLARLEEDESRGLQRAREAVEASQGLGPGAAAQTAFEAGLSLLQRGRREGETYLKQAGRLYRELQSAGHEALAALALAALTSSALPDEVLNPALELLSRAEYRDEVLRHQGWLAPWLLGHVLGRAGAGQRIVQRWLQDGAHLLLRQLEHGALALEARRTLAAQSSLPLELVEELKRDSDAEVRGAVDNQATAAAGLRAFPELRIFTLGTFEVLRGQERVPNSAWRSQKGRHLLAYLAIQGGRPVSEDVLIDLFWPDDAEKGKRSLYWVTSILRSALRSPEQGGDVDYIVRHQGMLVLNPELPIRVDLEQMEGLWQRAAQSTSPTEKAEAQRKAVALYRGPFMEGCYMDWAEAVRERAWRGLCEALASLAGAAQQAGRAAECLEHAQRLWELDPCRQDACLLAMQALQSLGRAEEAVRLFERCRRALARELEMEPGIPLLEAHQRALLSL